jgi:hypothetical protein
VEKFFMKSIRSFFRQGLAQRNKLLWLALVVLVGQSIWLLLSSSRYRIGFPLDDAWIHQTYARNFVENFRWEYNSGQISGGSTSPLWTILLMPGYLFKGNFFYFWTFFLGFVLLTGSAYLFEAICSKLIDLPHRIPWFGLLLILEWHIFWAANSGMETILFIFLVLLAVYWVIKNEHYSLRFNILLGVLLWVRPDALTFFAVPLFIFFIEKITLRPSFAKIVPAGIVLFISVFLYAGFNKLVAGSFFPNTFYAKQAEYSILYELPLAIRVLNLFLIPITGAGALMLPGFFYQAFQIIRKKNWKLLAILLWLLGYVLLFAIRLPVTYQHGRYIIPVIPIYLMFGLLGSLSLGALIRWKQFGSVLKKTWAVSTVLLLLIFWGLGASAFAEDVSIIESEMVDTANWINEHTSTDAVIAAHDIGALGYFADRSILDLAGLISPEVIPFMNNEEQLANYLDTKKVDYLMTFPNWYLKFTDGKSILYSGSQEFSILAGGEHMAVFKWQE